MDILEKAELRGGGVAPTLEEIISEVVDTETDYWYEHGGNELLDSRSV